MVSVIYDPRRDPVYFTASDGVVYRVYDAIMRTGVLVIANPPGPPEIGSPGEVMPVGGLAQASLSVSPYP